jgi:hypothetical protein
MSIGFVVARDEWDDDMEHRQVHSFADLPDVSAVTYPASPTTSIDVARRMVFSMPLESAARARKFYVDARAGVKMSASNSVKVLGALHTLHTALGDAGANVDSLYGEPDDQANVASDPEPELVSEDDGTIGGGSDNNEGTNLAGASLADGTGGALAEPGEPIRAAKPAQTLRLQLEAAKRRRITTDE